MASEGSNTAIEPTVVSARDTLGDVVTSLRGLRGSCAGLASAELATVVGLSREVQGAVGSVLMEAGARAASLAEAGAGPPAIDALRGGDRVPVSVARRDAARVAAAVRLPVLAAAVGEGRLTIEEFDLASTATEDLTDEQLSRFDQDEIAGLAGRISWYSYCVGVRSAAREASGETREDKAESAKDRSKAKLFWDEAEQLGHLRLQIDGERFAEIRTVVEQLMRSMAAANEAGDGMNAKLMAEAIYRLITGSGARNVSLPHIVVVVDGETVTNGEHENTMSETSNGIPVPLSAIHRMACHATLRNVALSGGGGVVNVGRTVRTATDAQWDAIRAMYSTCGYPACAVALSHCQIHHVHFWRNGGRTDLENLVPLCTAHHDLVHTKGWELVLHKDRSLEVYRPDGTLMTNGPPPTRRPTKRHTPGRSKTSDEDLAAKAA